MRKLAAGTVASFLLVLLVLTPLLKTSEAGRVAGGAGDFSTSSSSSTRWGLSAIKAREAWNVTTGSQEIVVAVIDSGIDRTIPALEKNAWKNEDEIPNNGKDDDGNGYVDDVSGWDFREGESLKNQEKDLHYHGTFVAGLVGSTYDKNTGAGGVAPEVSIMDLRFLDEKGKFYTSDWDKLADAIDYAVENGADIINMSLYTSLKPPKSVHEAVRRAESRGVLVVGIAGNSGGEVDHLGSWKETLTVGSVNRSKQVSGFSNRGPSVDLVAPGESVLSFKPGGEAVTGSGTSFAAPHVTGTAALILSRNPDMKLSELKNTLKEAAQDVGQQGRDDSTGFGLIDSKDSLNAVSSVSEEVSESTEEKNKDHQRNTGVTTYRDGEYEQSEQDLSNQQSENQKSEKKDQGEFRLLD